MPGHFTNSHASTTTLWEPCFSIGRSASGHYAVLSMPFVIPSDSSTLLFMCYHHTFNRHPGYWLNQEHILKSHLGFSLNQEHILKALLGFSLNQEHILKSHLGFSLIRSTSSVGMRSV